jgi:hypothetical protein
MSTDIRTRIEALRPPPTPPGTVSTAAATPAPDDPKNLMPMFIDLVAELWVAIRDMQRVAAETESGTKRALLEVPAACRQAVREEMRFLHAQAAEQQARVASREAPPNQEAAACRDWSIWILIGVCAAAVGAALLIRHLC